MSAPRFLRDNFSHVFGTSALPVLEEYMRYELQRHPSVRERIFKKVATDRDIWQYSELHDMSMPEQLEEGQEYSFEAQPQGASKTLKPVKYGLGFSISEEAVEDGRFDFIADALAKLAKSAREAQEIQGMNVINNGSSSETTADGVSLFNASHPLPSGGTFRNQLGTPSDLSDASLEQMLIDFETQFVGDSGIIYRIAPKILLVHPDNKRLAMELIGSDLRPAVELQGATGITNVNNMNSLKQEGLVVVSSPHLTDADAWGLLAMPEDTGLRIISRKDIETKAAGADVGFTRDSILYKIRYREKVGAVHPYGAFWTAGA